MMETVRISTFILGSECHRAFESCLGWSATYCRMEGAGAEWQLPFGRSGIKLIWRWYFTLATQELVCHFRVALFIWKFNSWRFDLFKNFMKRFEDFIEFFSIDDKVKFFILQFISRQTRLRGRRRVTRWHIKLLVAVACCYYYRSKRCIGNALFYCSVIENRHFAAHAVNKLMLCSWANIILIWN